MTETTQGIEKLMLELKEDNQKMQAAQTELSGLRKQINSLSTDISRIRTDIEHKRKNVRPQEGARDRSINPIETLQEELKPLEAQQEELNSSLIELRNSIKSLDALIAGKNIQLLNLKRVAVSDESNLIMRNALKTSGLLEPIKEILDLNKTIYQEDWQLKESLVKSFFNAVLLDEKDSFNEPLNVETQTQA